MNRRQFLDQALRASAGAAGVFAGAGRTHGQSASLVKGDGARPTAIGGVASGDVDLDRAVVWSRADRSSRMVVEWDTTDAFRNPRRIIGPAALEDTDFTARVDLTGLPAAQRIVYRVRFQDLNDLRSWSEPVVGTFVTPEAQGPRPTRDVTVAWTADTCGQGWGIDTARGGLRLYESMRRAEPDAFIHCGDTIYADQPVVAEVKLDDASVWRSLVTPEKSKPAETLDEFRGNFRYNLLDEHVRQFNAAVGQFTIWDDHEVLNNWQPEQMLDAKRPYTVKSVALLAARAKRAFLEYQPQRFVPGDPERIYRAVRLGPLVDVLGFDMRSYRGSNTSNVQPRLDDASRILGAAQVEWLKQRLAVSTATWKVIASDMPIGLVVPDTPPNFEAVANGHAGPPLGRELEIADLLRFIRDRKIRNVVFVTGDVHYAAAHHYDPARAAFHDFTPFWEFVAGPAHAGTFGPNPLDATFGPEVRFLGIPAGMKPNRPPSDGFQFFGTLRVSAKTRVMTARLHNLAGGTIFSVDLPPP